MKSGIIFQKIINREISSDIIYQDDIVTAFTDIQPKAKVHILIVPNLYIISSNDINNKNKNIIGHMFYIAVKIAKLKKINQNGYRIIVNCNKDSGQEINYLHMHLLGGEKLKY
ncbi:MAG: HIT domain-containing protein [Buchnera aphidicola]|nr:HIT domain-containing protein [Buchnera aphidicola]MDE5285833.1 HIT domain-containing protein [Buchnera aphidicola]